MSDLPRQRTSHALLSLVYVLALCGGALGQTLRRDDSSARLDETAHPITEENDAEGALANMNATYDAHYNMNVSLERDTNILSASFGVASRMTAVLCADTAEEAIELASGRADSSSTAVELYSIRLHSFDVQFLFGCRKEEEVAFVEVTFTSSSISIMHIVEHKIEEELRSVVVDIHVRELDERPTAVSRKPITANDFDTVFDTTHVFDVVYAALNVTSSRQLAFGDRSEYFGKLQLEWRDLNDEPTWYFGPHGTWQAGTCVLGVGVHSREVVRLGSGGSSCALPAAASDVPRGCQAANDAKYLGENYASIMGNYTRCAAQNLVGYWHRGRLQCMRDAGLRFSEPCRNCIFQLGFCSIGCQTLCELSHSRTFGVAQMCGPWNAPDDDDGNPSTCMSRCRADLNNCAGVTVWLG